VRARSLLPTGTRRWVSENGFVSRTVSDTNGARISHQLPAFYPRFGLNAGAPLYENSQFASHAQSSSWDDVVLSQQQKQILVAMAQMLQTSTIGTTQEEPPQHERSSSRKCNRVNLMTVTATENVTHEDTVAQPLMKSAPLMKYGDKSLYRGRPATYSSLNLIL
jgi:hypothetical protein